MFVSLNISRSGVRATYFEIHSLKLRNRMPISAIVGIVMIVAGLGLVGYLVWQANNSRQRGNSEQR